LRERVVTAVEGGEYRRAVSVCFGVSYSSVNKLVSRYRQTGSVKPLQIGGYRHLVLANEHDFIGLCLKECLDISLDSLRKRLEGARGLKVSHVTVWHMLKREKMSFKKTLCAVECLRTAIIANREAWVKLQQSGLDSTRTLFIDETWVKANMSPYAAGVARARDSMVKPLLDIGRP